MVLLVKLVAELDDLGYLTQVWECIEERYNYSKYIMTVMYPNWDQKPVEIDDIGYLRIEERVAGVSQWFDGNEMHFFNYDAVQFIKFVPKKEKEDHKFIMKD